MSFNSSNRARLLLSKKFLHLLADKVLITRQELRTEVNQNKQAENIALSAIWALSDNNHKAKVAFSDTGITKLLTEESHRREVENELKNNQMNQEHRVRFLDDKENSKPQLDKSMLKEVLCILNR